VAYIKYLNLEDIPEKNQVLDSDNILRIHSVNSKIMRSHYNLYIDLMKKKSSLSRIQREKIAVLVSSLNGCEY